MSENDKNTRQELIDSFQGKSAHELSELLADLTLNYVIRQRRPTVEQLAMMPVPDDLRELSFSELIVVLQSQLGLRELGCFSVDDDVVSVQWGEHRLIMSDTAQNESMQSPRVSSTPASAAKASSGQSPAKSSATKPAQAETKAPDTSGSDASDRFSMLEID